MLWQIFSVINASINATANVIDKYVLSKWVKNPLNSALILGIIQVVVSIIIFMVVGFKTISLMNLFLALISGMCYMLMTIFYFKSVQMDEVSRVAPLFSLTPILVLIFAFIFLNEFFTYWRYAGIFVIIIGAILLSYKPKTKMFFGKAFGVMLLAVFFLAISNVITKYLLNFYDYWTVFAYTRIGVIFIIIPLCYYSYKDLKLIISRHGFKAIFFISISELFILLGAFAGILALSLGPVTLVSAFSSIQNFILLFITFILSILFPHIIKEKIDKNTFFLKIIAITLMLIGIILIS